MNEDALKIVHKEIRVINMINTRDSVFSFSPEAVTVALLGKNLKQSNSKFQTEVTLSGYPPLKKVDAQGNPTSEGSLTQFKMSFEIEKEAAVFNIMDIDMRSLSQVGTITEVLEGIRDVALDAYIDKFSYVLNNATTGIFRTFNGEIPSLVNRGANSIWSKIEADGSITNMAKNLGSNAFGNAGILDAKKNIRTHMTPYRTRVKANIIGAIVDRRNYDAAADIVASNQLGTDRKQLVSSYRLPLGVLDFKNENDWWMITDKTQVGFGYYPGMMFPQHRTHRDGVSNNAKIITEHFTKGYIARATGYFQNKF